MLIHRESRAIFPAVLPFAYTNKNREVARLAEELQQARIETQLARAAEESLVLTAGARQDQFEQEKRELEARYGENVGRLETEVAEVSSNTYVAKLCQTNGIF